MLICYGFKNFWIFFLLIFKNLTLRDPQNLPYFSSDKKKYLGHLTFIPNVNF